MIQPVRISQLRPENPMAHRAVLRATSDFDGVLLMSVFQGE
jgi:hypothetical protein